MLRGQFAPQSPEGIKKDGRLRLREAALFCFSTPLHQRPMESLNGGC